MLIAGPGDHGRRRRRQRAGHAVHHPPRLSRRETRADALGVWAAVSGLALALGPVIGGALVGFSSWRAIFWFNLGFGVVAFVLAAVAVPETSDRQGRRIDVLGIRLRRRLLASSSFAVIQGEESGYTAPWIVALFVLCGLSRHSRSS